MKKIILNILIFPIVIGIVLILAPLEIIGNIFDLYAKINEDLK